MNSIVTEINNLEPTLTITNPSPGTYESATFYYSATQSSAYGTSFSYLSIYIDSSSSPLKVSTNGATSVGVNIDPYSYASGVHALKATLSDSDGVYRETYIEVTFASSGGGGNGCVAQNTRISLPNGHFKKVQALKVGDEVLGYNTTSHETMTVTVTKINETDGVHTLLSINNGLLRVTTTEQPIYMQNSTYIGWISDPQNLKVGDQIFNVITNQWISINQIELIHGHFKTYDVATDPLNTFIGNGILLDMPVKN